MLTAVIQRYEKFFILRLDQQKFYKRLRNIRIFFQGKSLRQGPESAPGSP